MGNKRIEQIRTNALVAKELHAKKLRGKNGYKIALNAMTIIVPILFLTAQYWAKSTQLETVINIVASLGSIALLCFAIFAIIIDLDGKIIKHTIGVKNNIFVATEAIKLMEENDENKLGWFYTYVAEVDTTDTDSLSGVSAEEKMTAYRESLKQLFPGESAIVCPVCNASPYIYEPGSCQVCGNKPK